MGAQVKKKEEEAPAPAAKPSRDFAGRFAAWWDGRDYVPPVPGEGCADKKSKAERRTDQKIDRAEAKVEKAEESKSSEAPPAPAPEPTAEAFELTPAEQHVPAKPFAGSAEIRIKAVEALWGEGRLLPGSFALDTKLLDALLEHADKPGDIGFLGCDAALLTSFAGQSDRKAIVAEWRADCLPHLQTLAPKAEVSPVDLDRPKAFGDGALEGLVSIDAFAYADHKAGLVGRACRALADTGRWVFLDTTRTTKKTPPEAFASAWAEPQLATNDEIEELLKLAGFCSCRKIPVTDLVLDAARQGYAQLSQILEQASQGGLTGREGALFLQELAWEAQSWRARMRSLEGGALEINLWIADKVDRTSAVSRPLSDDMLDASVLPDDAGASEALFEKNN